MHHFNMRHPLTGGGMTVALSDIVVLRNLIKPLRNLHDASALCKYLESFYTLRKVSLQLFILQFNAQLFQCNTVSLIQFFSFFSRLLQQ